MILFIVFLLTLALFLELKRLHLSWRFRDVPGALEIPLIGSKYALFPNNISDIEKICLEVQKDQKVAKLFFGPRLMLLIADPELMKQLLHSRDCVDRPYVFKFLRLDHGLTASRKHWWTPLRKSLNVSFSQSIVNSLVPMLDRSFRSLALELDSYVGRGPFDVYSSISTSLFESICEAVLEEKVKEGFVAAEMEELEDIVCKRIFTAFHHLSVIFKMSHLYRREMEIRDKMATVLLKILDRKRAQIKQKDYQETRKFLERLLTVEIHGKKLDDVQLVENLVNFLIGGFDTSATALAYSLLMLAMHPRVQEKAVTEIQKVFGDSLPHELTSEDLKRLPYLELVLTESMRLFPPIPVSARETTADITLGSLRIPKGTVLGLNIYCLHRSERLWGPDWREFRPERFLTSENRHPYSYLPFTAGSRNCIGAKYGIAAVKMGLLHLLRSFRFSSKLRMDELKTKFSISLKLTNGHMVQIERRSRELA